MCVEVFITAIYIRANLGFFFEIQKKYITL